MDRKLASRRDFRMVMPFCDIAGFSGHYGLHAPTYWYSEILIELQVYAILIYPEIIHSISRYMYIVNTLESYLSECLIGLTVRPF